MPEIYMYYVCPLPQSVAVESVLLLSCFTLMNNDPKERFVLQDVW